MEWQTPEINLFKSGTFNKDGMGSDSSLANILLLADKYDTEIAVEDGVLYRYYHGKSENRRGYGFPLSDKPIDLKACISLLSEDARRRNVPLEFCLCDENQKEQLDKVVKVSWNSTVDDNDYIYSRERLATLSGRKLQKKRNHVNHFKSTYPDWHYEQIGMHNKCAALEMATKWLEERGEPSVAEILEYESIGFTLLNFYDMNVFGGILYVGEQPVAMTIASEISPSCVDVHYEKAIGDYAHHGAFAAVNQCFASSEAVSKYEFVNREEDMGIEGLRRAKETYDPLCKLQKFYGKAVI